MLNVRATRVRRGDVRSSDPGRGGTLGGPTVFGRERVRLDGRPGAVVRRARRLRRRGRQLHRHRRLVRVPLPRKRSRPVGERHRPSGSPPAATGTTSSSPRKVGGPPERKGPRPSTAKAAAEDSPRRMGTDHLDVYDVHFDDASGARRGHRHHARRTGAGRKGTGRRGVPHQPGATSRRAAVRPPRGPGALPGAPAPLQPRLARRLRGRAPGHRTARRAGLRPVPRPRLRFPDRETPAGSGGGQRARRPRPGRPPRGRRARQEGPRCPWGRSRRRTAHRWRLSPSHGLCGSRPWSHRSPPHGRRTRCRPSWHSGICACPTPSCRPWTPCPPDSGPHARGAPATGPVCPEWSGRGGSAGPPRVRCGRRCRGRG